MKQPLLILLSALTITACNSTTAQPVEAVITNSSPEIRAEIEQILINATGSTRVPIADSALIHNHKLFIERQPVVQRQTGLPVTGINRDKPRVFKLYKTGEKCELVDSKTNKHYPLLKAKCEPVADS